MDVSDNNINDMSDFTNGKTGRSKNSTYKKKHKNSTSGKPETKKGKGSTDAGNESDSQRRDLISSMLGAKVYLKIKFFRESMETHLNFNQTLHLKKRKGKIYTPLNKICLGWTLRL